MGYNKTVSVIVLAIALGACGGGGGGGGGTTTTAPTLQINNANAPGVSGSVVDTTGDVAGAGDSTSPVSFSATSSGNASLVSVANRALQAALKQHSGFKATAAADITTQTLNCPGGGSITVTLNDADNNLELSAGDTIQIDFSQCSEDGELLNGSASFNNLSISGDVVNEIPPWSISATFAFTSLQLTANSLGGGTETATINGAFNFSASTSDNVIFNTTITATSLSVADNSGTETLTNFSFSEASNDSTSAFTNTFSGTLNSPALGGIVNFSTPVALQGVGDNYPSSGEIFIVGMSSSVRVIALDSVNVRLETDADGDGIVDADGVRDTTWASIDL